MYTRLTKTVPSSIVHNGKINFGTFEGVTNKLDIRGVQAPFAGIPTARIFSNFRIKSRITVTFTLKQYIGYVEFFDDKVFGVAEVLFCDIETKQKYYYNNLMGPRKRFVPTNTYEAVVSSFSHKKYIKISWNRGRKKLNVNISIKGDAHKPSTKAIFSARFIKNQKNELLCVNPAPTTQRCSATWLVPLSIYGSIGFSKKFRLLKEGSHEQGLALMQLNRTYLKAQTFLQNAVGFIEQDNKKIIFNFTITSQEALDEDLYNNNILSVNDIITPMPPVVITQPFGLTSKWIIQDVESMVDLTFTPKVYNTKTLNIIVMRNHNLTLAGTFDGVLITKDGEKIVLKNCPGICKKSTLRL